jgi:2-keto-4-pentenoate hydratase/2-oxohepta-3-ene-1,7-dioic acid hydratase in catechol pathway
MKLLRYGPKGAEKPGCLDDQGQIHDLSDYIQDISSDFLSAATLKKLREVRMESLPIVKGNHRIGPCVNRVGKFLCIGLNYADHAAETGSKVPVEPVLFSKVTSSICGPRDDLIIPMGSVATDWEAELGVVIGQPAKRIAEADALNYVAGYCVINDVSERDYQLRGTGQWIKGKSCDTFGQIGPWLVTTDEIPDPQCLSIWLEVDGKRYQYSSTQQMIYKVAYLVSYLSHFFTLYPGDIISTGTPAGVGMAQKPESIYLRPGQRIRLGIDGLGEQDHLAVAEVDYLQP